MLLQVLGDVERKLGYVLDVHIQLHRKLLLAHDKDLRAVSSVTSSLRTTRISKDAVEIFE